MASLRNCSSFCKYGANSFDGVSAPPFLLHMRGSFGTAALWLPQGSGLKWAFHWQPQLFIYDEKILRLYVQRPLPNIRNYFEKLIQKRSFSFSKKRIQEANLGQSETPFGYTRKDVLLIGVGVTVIGYGLKSGLELFGVDPLQAGNVVEVIVVLGLTLGWVSTYIFRVSNKEMTYAQQLRDYEDKVMQKRLEGLTEAELEALLEQVEEEKRRLASGEQVS